MTDKPNQAESSKSHVEALKSSIKSLWDMENELRYSAWSWLTLDKEKAQLHIAEARRHLNAILNEAEPSGHTVDQPPVLKD